MNELKYHFKNYAGIFWLTIALMVVFNFILSNDIRLNVDLLTSSVQFPVLLIVILLVPLNLVSESLKVKLVFGTQCSYENAVRLTSQGMLFNLILPLGIGTLAGRSMYSDGLSNIQNTSSTVLMSLLQSCCNILAGVIFGYHYLILINFDDLISTGVAVIILLAIISAALFIITIQRFEFCNEVINSFKTKCSLICPLLRKSVLLPLILLTLLRYFIYLFQMSLLVYSLCDHHWYSVLSSAAFYFLLISIIQTQGVFSLLGRSGFAIVAFTPLGLGAEEAICISLFIYLLNNAIPALFGGYLLFNKANSSVR